MSLTVEDRTVRGPASDWVVLTVGGCLDQETAWMLRERLIRLLDEGSRCFVLDLEGVELLDSTAWECSPAASHGLAESTARCSWSAPESRC